MAQVDIAVKHRWAGDDTCMCACGEDVGNDHSWALHLLGKLREESRTVNYRNGALIRA